MLQLSSLRAWQFQLFSWQCKVLRAAQSQILQKEDPCTYKRCGNNHPASYRSCKFYPKLPRSTKSAREKPRRKNPVVSGNRAQDLPHGNSAATSNGTEFLEFVNCLYQAVTRIKTVFDFMWFMFTYT